MLIGISCRYKSCVLNTAVSRKLELNHLSIPVTVGIFDGQVLVDPSLEEEAALHGLVTCVFALPNASLSFVHQVSQKD